MFNDIDKIQAEIDKLNSLCPVSLDTDLGVDWTDIKPRRRERLGIYILKLLDGLLEPRYIARLEKWLVADAAARHYYVDFMKLTAMLHLYFNPERLKTPILPETAKK